MRYKSIYFSEGIGSVPRVGMQHLLRQGVGKERAFRYPQRMSTRLLSQLRTQLEGDHRPDQNHGTYYYRFESPSNAPNQIRQCPVCRQETHFIIPCSRMVFDADRKNILIEEYKKNLAHIPCRHFDEGRGECPFGSSCFYTHCLPDGSVVETIVRTAVDSQGRYDVLPRAQFRLDDYLSK
jgi:hypothetical protein